MISIGILVFTKKFWNQIPSENVPLELKLTENNDSVENIYNIRNKLTKNDCVNDNLSSFCHNIKVVPLRKKKTQKDTMFLLCVPNVIVCNQLLNLKPPPLDIRLKMF